MSEERNALVIMRGQPPHEGHAGLIRTAKEQCGRVTIGLGSTQKHGVVRHPMTPEQRIDMLWAIFGRQFMQDVRIIPLQDIDSLDDTDDWARYVLGKIAKQKLPEPTDYYTGSMFDAKWYFTSFAGPDDEVVENGKETIFARGGKRLHIIDRTMTGFPPAEELRSLIERRDPEWRRYVPEAIHDMIEEGYPAHLRVALRGTAFPENPKEGLAFIREDMTPPTRFEFRRDRWNKVRPENASKFR